MKIKASKVHLILEIVELFLSNLDSNNNGWIETAELAEGLVRVTKRLQLPWYARLVLQKPLLVLVIDRIAALVPSPEAVKLLQKPESLKQTTEQTPQGQTTDNPPAKNRVEKKLESLASAAFLEEAVRANQVLLQKLADKNS